MPTETHDQHTDQEPRRYRCRPVIRETSANRTWRRIHEFPGEVAAEFGINIEPAFFDSFEEVFERARLFHRLERRY